MESNRYDCVVVGAGLAGLIAAAVAASEGLSVALAATGPGSWVLGDGRLRAGLPAAAEEEHHLAAAVAFFRQLMDGAGTPYAGELPSRHLLPTILGDFEPVSLAPGFLWEADPRDGLRTAVAGIAGLSSFDENFMADRLQENARLRGQACIHEPRRVALRRGVAAPLSALTLAHLFDRDADFRAGLMESLRAAALGFDRILLPCVLGIQADEHLREECARAAGCRIAELPTVPPSVAGLRLYHRLEKHLRSRGVEFYMGFPVQSVNIQGKICRSVALDAPGRPTILRGEMVILAAGRCGESLLGAERAGNLQLALPPRSGNENLCANTARIASGYRAGLFAAAKDGQYV